MCIRSKSAWSLTVHCSWRCDLQRMLLPLQVVTHLEVPFRPCLGPGRSTGYPQPDSWRVCWPCQGAATMWAQAGDGHDGRHGGKRSRRVLRAVSWECLEPQVHGFCLQTSCTTQQWLRGHAAPHQHALHMYTSHQRAESTPSAGLARMAVDGAQRGVYRPHLVSSMARP
jgi:hypothetical protein